MPPKPNYRKTQVACYLGFITQAITANFAPLLFLTFQKTYGISLAEIALIPLVFFVTQILVDLICARYVDRIGYRKSIIASGISCAGGLFLLTFLPDVVPAPFIGILLSTVIYAFGSGLIEVLCSPIIEACPFEDKDRMLSLLHSFFCWGSVGTILGSTLFFAVFGIENWRILACLWALIPAFNIYNFATCPIDPIIPEGEGMSMRQLFQTRIFWLLILLMVCAGASELCVSQWASAFAESSLGVKKTLGDLLGPCGFAAFMGLSRLLYGKHNGKMNLKVFMIVSGVLCVTGYLLAGFARWPLMGLAGCMLCGFACGIMWPGTIRLASGYLPYGGTAMFALLAMAGDLGGAAGPALVGNVSQLLGENIQAGLVAGLCFPAILVAGLLMLRKVHRESTGT